MAAPILLPGLAKLLGCRGGLFSDDTIEPFLVDDFFGNSSGHINFSKFRSVDFSVN